MYCWRRLESEPTMHVPQILSCVRPPDLHGMTGTGVKIVRINLLLVHCARMLRRRFLESSTVIPILLTRPRMARSTPAKGAVLVSGGHPGDPEYGCGGMIAKLANAGYRVSILYLNRGEKGCCTAGVNCGITRTREAQNACRRFNCITRHFFDLIAVLRISPTKMNTAAFPFRACRQTRPLTGGA